MDSSGQQYHCALASLSVCSREAGEQRAGASGHQGGSDVRGGRATQENRTHRPQPLQSGSGDAHTRAQTQAPPTDVDAQIRILWAPLARQAALGWKFKN